MTAVVAVLSAFAGNLGAYWVMKQSKDLEFREARVRQLSGEYAAYEASVLTEVDHLYNNLHLIPAKPDEPLPPSGQVPNFWEGLVSMERVRSEREVSLRLSVDKEQEAALGRASEARLLMLRRFKCSSGLQVDFCQDIPRAGRAEVAAGLNKDSGVLVRCLADIRQQVRLANKI